MEEVKLLNLKDETYVYVPDNYWDDHCEPETFYVLSEEELKPEQEIMIKMINIIRRRALQEIKKSEADEHGYRFLDAEVRKYDGREKAFLIKKATPYSTKMDLKAVKYLIVSDIEEFYNGVLGYNEKKIGQFGNVTAKDILGYAKHEKKFYDDVNPESDYGVFFEHMKSRNIEIGDPLVVDIKNIHANLGSGYYEVSYWATGII